MSNFCTIIKMSVLDLIKSRIKSPPKIIKIFITLLLSQPLILANQKVADSTRKNLLVEIITNDRNEFIGYLNAENNETITIKTLDGINITIPKNTILRKTDFAGKAESGRIFREDPNKSLYMFAPSAFPIGQDKSYCRDFCVFFPSYNKGYGQNISVQLGGFWLPGMLPWDAPLVGSIKLSLPSISITQLAGGIMYVRMPFEDDFATGFTFLTGTIGNNFTHMSATLGWGYGRDGDNWNFMDRPILTLAGNYRASNRFALIYEGWFLPDRVSESQPIMGSLRFLGKDFSFDFGGLTTFNLLGENFILPIVNFAYYLN